MSDINEKVKDKPLVSYNDKGFMLNYSVTRNEEIAFIDYEQKTITFKQMPLPIDKIKDIDGTLIIKEYPTKSASTQTLKNHIEKLRKRGIEPDMILVDYADLLRPVRSSGEKRHELEETYEGLRGLAQTYEIPIWTASQTNRGGLNAEVITMEAISEAFNKCFVADFIFSLSRTVQDKQANKGRIFVAKNRNGPDGIVFDAFVDWSDVTINILDRDEASESMITTAEQSRILKEKYIEQLKAK